MTSWTPDITVQQAYVALVRRIQSIISSPKAQIDHQAVIAREEGELRSNWERLLTEIRDAEGVTVTALEDGSYLVSWFVTPEY